MSTINIDKTWLSITICTQNNYGKIPFYKNDKKRTSFNPVFVSLIKDSNSRV